MPPDLPADAQADLNGLADGDRAEHDRLISEIRAADRESFRAEVRLGALLLALVAFRARVPRHERDRPWSAVAVYDLEMDVSRTYHLMDTARVDDALRQAGVDPLENVSQCVAVAKGDVRHDPALIVAVVEAGRALAEAEGVASAARHFVAARTRLTDDGAKAGVAESEPERSEAEANGTVGEDEDPDSERSTERARTRSHRGALVVVPVSAVESGRVDAGAVLGRPLPNKAVVPYEAVAHDPALLRPERRRPASQITGFARAHLDDLTDLTWPVLAVDPWTPALAWALPEDQPLVTFYPDRLDHPRARPKRDATDRDRTVLVAPGVDPLHPDVPDAVVRAVVGDAGADPGRRYLLMTEHPDRAWADGWPQNVYVAAVADGTPRSEAALGRIDGRHTGEVPHALVARDLKDGHLGPLTGWLTVFAWVLVRGPGTSQAAYDALRGAVEPDRFDRGRDVRARHGGYPPLPEAPAPAPSASGTPKGRPARRPPAVAA